jgi:hypothetical protein
MSSFSLFSIILNQNKVAGPNYVDWKHNLDTILIAKGNKFVLTEACPNDPTANASEGVRHQFDHWKKSDEMAKCYILTSVSNVIKHLVQDVDHADSMMNILKEMMVSKVVLLS